MSCLTWPVSGFSLRVGPHPDALSLAPSRSLGPRAPVSSLGAPRRERGKISVTRSTRSMPPRSTPSERPITPDGLARLLERLSPNPAEAASRYQHLRLTLEKFFDWHRAWPPEECADETIDRLIRKLGSDIDIADVRRYALGIARLVLLEWQRRPTAVSVRDAATVSAPETAETDEDSLRACFDRCLAALSPESRTLVLDYYVDDRRAKIDNRRQLAARFGVSESALRNRVQRVRDRLERCVHACKAMR
jgi:DNA-directed RNA polymerase specialized sigma24 family protein